MSSIKSFTDLNVSKQGHILVLNVYKYTKSFPREETYTLVGKIRRAALLITSNIAEGFGRNGYKEKIQFFYLASGSLSELRNQFIVAQDLKYIDQHSYNLLENQAENVSKLLYGIIKTSKNRVK